MRNLRLLGWAAAVAAATAAPAVGQTTNTSGTTTTTTTSSGSGTNTGPSGGTGNANAGGPTITPTTLATSTTPPVSAPSSMTTGNTNKVDVSNFLRNTYGAVYYQGRNGATVSSNATGGFGNPLYTASGGTGTGTTTGAGRATGGANGSVVNDQGGVIVPLPRNISYPAQIKFATQPIGAGRLQGDLRGTIDRSSSLVNPAGVQVFVTGKDVTVRGTVRDEDEVRLVEGLIRLTPGVGAIRNELTFPRP